MNAAKQLNLENILHDLNKSSELSGYLNNTTNSARQRVNNEHNSSMAPYIKKGQLKKIASHNKSSNLAFSILGKSELLEDRQTQVSQSRKYDRVSSLSRGSVSSSKAGSGIGSKPKKTWPMKPSYVLKSYRDVLTEYEKTEILDYQEIYFVGPNAKKIRGLPCQDDDTKFHYKEIGNNNNRYDDERGDYKIVIGDHIGYRYEVKEKLGKGSFGQVFKCWDHKEKEYIALKVIRNKKKLQYQAKIEVSILDHLRE